MSYMWSCVGLMFSSCCLMRVRRAGFKMWTLTKRCLDDNKCREIFRRHISNSQSYAGVMLVQRLQRCTNFKPAQDQRPVFAGQVDGFPQHLSCFISRYGKLVRTDNKGTWGNKRPENRTLIEWTSSTRVSAPVDLGQLTLTRRVGEEDIEMAAWRRQLRVISRFLALISRSLGESYSIHTGHTSRAVKGMSQTLSDGKHKKLRS